MSHKQLISSLHDNNTNRLLNLLASGLFNLNDDNMHPNPLNYASKYAMHEHVKILLENGASVNKKSELGVTALHEACSIYMRDEYGMFAIVVKQLLKYGADTYAVDMFGLDPLQHAFDPEIISIIKQHRNKKPALCVLLLHINRNYSIFDLQVIRLISDYIS
jgi:ankyrin repeat protein